MSRNVVIVGAGLAGSRCAQTLRAEGFDGSIALVGEEPHPPYERPALSKEFLAGTREELLLQGSNAWAELEIDLELGVRVERIDTTRRLASTSRGDMVWDALVLATGARARRPAAFGGSGVTSSGPSTTRADCVQSSSPAGGSRSSDRASSVPRSRRRLSSSGWT